MTPAHVVVCLLGAAVTLFAVAGSAHAPAARPAAVATRLPAAPAAGAQPPYYRFWHGKRLSNLSLGEFSGDIHKFIVATTEVGEGIALDTYIPVLTPAPGPEATWTESALVAYVSSSAYHELMSSPRGIRYQHSHWNLFNKSCSSSRVPTPYHASAPLQIDHAADVLNGTTLWYAPGTAAFHVVHNRTIGTSTDAEYAAAVNTYVQEFTAAAGPVSAGGAGLGLISWVVRLDAGAVFEYQLWDGPGRRQAALATEAGRRALDTLHRVAVEFCAIAAPAGSMTVPIEYGQGLSVSLPPLPSQQ